MTKTTKICASLRISLLVNTMLLLFSIISPRVFAFTKMTQHHIQSKGRPCMKLPVISNAENDDAKSALQYINNYEAPAESSKCTLSRRKLLRKSILTTSLLSLPFCGPFASKASDESSTFNSNISVYQVIPDDSAALSPSIKPIKPSNFDAILSFQENNLGRNKLNKSRKQSEESSNGQNGGVVWFGEHHSSKADHDLQTQFIQSIYDQQLASNGKRNHKMSIGLEQVQIQFQPYLDDFVAGHITEKEMLEGVQWQKRWHWDYDNYRPIFDLSRKFSIPLIALNVNSEDLAIIEESGIRGLSKSQLQTYISDPMGFGTFLQSSAYKAYNSYLIEPSYTLHQQMGILKTTVTGKVLENDIPYANFFSGHIMWDESMAWNAYKWTRDNPGGIMIGLIGASHVKFEKGVVGRYKRLVEHGVRVAERKKEKEFQQVLLEESDSSSTNPRRKETFLASTAIFPPEHRECLSVLLNPTLVDSRPSGSILDYTDATSLMYNPDRMTLQLSYLKDGLMPDAEEITTSSSLASNTAGGVLPLADYIVMGS